MSQLMMDTIVVEDAPDVPGLLFRHFRGPEDYPGMLAVIAGSRETDQIEGVLSLADLSNDFEHLDNCNPFTDMVMVEIDGRLVGHGRCWWYEQLDGERIYFFYAHLLPAWRETGIREAMVCQIERRLREIAADHPSASPAYFQAWCGDTETHWSRVLESAGYQIVRYGLEMVRPDLENIPVCPLPDGIVVRSGSLAEWRQIWEAAREAFRDHWGAGEWPEEFFEGAQSESTFYPPLWRVAWAGDEVAGGVLNFIDHLENETYGRLRGYTETIFVRRPWRGQGLAKALIARSLLALREAGMTEAALGVDAENLSGALHLYRKMGFQESKQFMRYRKPL